MFWNILYPSAQNPTFPYPKTYGSALRNVRFPYANIEHINLSSNLHNGTFLFIPIPPHNT